MRAWPPVMEKPRSVKPTTPLEPDSLGVFSDIRMSLPLRVTLP